MNTKNKMKHKKKIQGLVQKAKVRTNQHAPGHKWNKTEGCYNTSLRSFILYDDDVFFCVSAMRVKFNSVLGGGIMF